MGAEAEAEAEKQPEQRSVYRALIQSLSEAEGPLARTELLLLFCPYLLLEGVQVEP